MARLRGYAADMYLHVLDRCIEPAAASVAERMLLPGEPVPSVTDVEQVDALASLVCKSAEAVECFLAFCEQQARDLLYLCDHGAVHCLKNTARVDRR